MKRLLLLAGICVLLLFSGCGVSSQYILTSEYINPNTNQVERIDIPVSQYVYDQTDVGVKYDVAVKTLIMGIRVPVTEQGNSRVALAETIPIMILVVPLGMFCWAIYQAIENRPKWWRQFMVSVGMLGAALLILSTNVPDFLATGIIVDKTFQIFSNSL